MNCRDWEEAIALYAGGDLEARRSLEVERHLAGCAGCQIFASGMLECLHAMRDGHRQEIAAAEFSALRMRVLARLRPAPWWRRRWLHAAVLAGAASCVLFLAFVHWTMRSPVPSPPVALARPPAPAAQVAAATPHAAPGRVHRAVVRKPAPAEPLTVRIVTDNPDVVIYWITNPRGE